MIVINGRFVTQNVTGVQRFARELVTELGKMRGDLLLAVPSQYVGPTEALGIRTLRIGGGLSGHLWEQFVLPIYLRSMGGPLLINLCSTAPIFYPRQVSSHHDITYVRHPESFPLRFRVLYKLLTPRMLRASRAVITVSEFSKSELAEHYRVPREKMRIVYNAVNKSLFSPARRTSTRPYYLAVSSLASHKNYPFLLSAFEQAGLGDVELRVVGSQAGLRGFRPTPVRNVVYEGRVSDERLVQLYRGALAFISPSLYEGFGIPVLEAQSCGCPVIASNIPAAREVLRDSAQYFDPVDVRSLSALLRSLATDFSALDRLKVTGFANAERFSWTKSADCLNEIINELSH